MKILLIIISITLLGALSYFFFLGYKSQTGYARGLIDSKLSRCPASPNCICSEYPEDKPHFTEPLDISGYDPERLSQDIRDAIVKSGGKPAATEKGYIYATYTSSIFRYVDDFEIRIDTSSNLLHIRSASRVGHSDMGANLKRIQQFKAQLKK